MVAVDLFTLWRNVKVYFKPMLMRINQTEKMIPCARKNCQLFILGIEDKTDMCPILVVT